MRTTTLWSLAVSTGLIAGCQSSTPAPEPAPADEPTATAAREPAVPEVEEPTPATGPATPAPDMGEELVIERDAAPDFDVRVLDGSERVKLSDFRGKVVLLVFWGID